MPSKPLTLLILVGVVLGVLGLSQVPPRETPAGVPPELQRLLSSLGAAPSPGGDGPRLEPGEPDTGLDTPPPDDDSPVDVRIKDLTLTMLNAEYTVPVEDPGTAEFVVLKIDAEGALTWGSLAAGSYDVILKLFKENYALYGDDLLAVITPDEATPWQYTYWALECAREAGLKKVGLGCAPGTDDQGTLLAMFEVFLPQGEIKLPEEMLELEIKIKVGEGDVPAYDVFDKEATSRQELFAKVSGYNGEYADEYGKDYSKDPAKTPWVIIAPPLLDTATVMRTMEAVRTAAVYSVRFGGEFPPRPGKKR